MRTFPARLAAISLATVALLVAACGGGDPSAEDRLPDLEGEGLELVDQIEDPFAEPGVDSRLALYQGDDGRGAQVRIYIYEDDIVAADRYATQAAALENPPPEFLGAEVEQDELEALGVGEESRSFVTARPDDAGNLVWTDIARSGAIITIAQLLAPEDDSGYSELRAEIVGSTFD